MSELNPYLQMVATFDHRNLVALDRAHNMFLIGALLSKKPNSILELGIGSGYITASLIHAIAYNKKGRLTSVDNWFDWNGKEPPGVDNLRKAGVNVIASPEEAFVRAAPTDAYDFLISDADHTSSHTWLDEHLRIVQPGGFMFFHDTHQPNVFPGLTTIEPRLRDKGIHCLHFTENSRPDEHCDRGFLFAVNKK